ncbi:MAG: UDP-glucose 4-epimerase [Candidatus Andersenbacteria bacterium RIFCSPHIGHO2_12_FULL_45_11b]|uniref:UDP-glucose 4-epimerase n=1 Tax=Candidatus Andersenbacteria bacterium RIFCSPHIGHO2_12_FULL_45_11b TaxID=1797282 RepID=A0A1G1XAF2_9BACT|nr:MAG: UDP-glucose 4-epimerase [Candidatus Andersenbacteria bacterium RIFCSPHIGHO2_12_FULL_45_11b]
MNTLHNVLVTGGAGYVGSVLVPKLLAAGHKVTVLDWFLFVPVVFEEFSQNSNLVLIKGDIRDEDTIKQALAGQDAVIHLACISNDPSFEMDPELGKSINYDASLQLFRLAKEMGVRRFIYASSSSVYGVKDEDKVTEDLSLEPLTDYSKFKAMCEPELLAMASETFVPLVLRPATVCGYSPRLRLDLTVNILTCHAIEKKIITVFGGDQTRPNIHIDDMTDLYVKTLEYSDEQIAGKIYNAGYDNFTVYEIAKMVQEVVGEDVEIIRQDSDDKRSYRVDSSKIKRELGFETKKTVRDAIADIADAFRAGKVPNALTDPQYYNIKMMQQEKQPA